MISTGFYSFVPQFVLILTHLNHTNPVLAEGSMEQTAVLNSGLQIAYTGMKFRR